MDNLLEQLCTKYNVPSFSVFVTVLAAMSGLTVIQIFNLKFRFKLIFKPIKQ